MVCIPDVGECIAEMDGRGMRGLSRQGRTRYPQRNGV